VHLRKIREQLSEKNMFDVIVPSKGRPDGTTFDLLRRARMAFIVVVEPQDVATYRAALSSCQATFWVLPRNDKGIGYSRAFIMKKATRPFVMVDDDITTVYKNGERAGIGAMLRAGWREYVRNGARGLLGFKHTTFALPKNTITHDTTLAHIVFMNPVDGVRYDPALRAFEDIDVLLRYHALRYPIRRLNTYVYYTTPSGKGTHGGIDYGTNAKVKRDALKEMARRYPGYITYEEGRVTRDGQPRYTLVLRPHKLKQNGTVLAATSTARANVNLP
jgi:hypothetical protein